MDFFKADLKKFLQQLSQQLFVELSGAAVDILCEAIESPEAEAFTLKMNQRYKSENTIGPDGKIVQVKTPSNLRNRIQKLDNDNYQLIMSIEEDRWFRANQLFGNNIIGKVGFKYTNIGE